jgi:Transcriptional regulator
VARAGLTRPEDVLGVTLMHDEVGDGWDEWMDAAGIGPLNGLHGPCFPHCELATTAAERGQGVALAYDAMVRDTVNSGRLIRLFDTVTLPRVIYSVAYPEARADTPRIRAFRDWLFEEIARDEAATGATRTAAE